MANFNKCSFGSTEYYEAELRQKQLIADLVKEAVAARIKNDDNKASLEELCVTVSYVSEAVDYAAKALDEAEAKENLCNGELV